MSRKPLVAFSERIYRVLIRLYPADFRLRYGDSMVQVFRDMSRVSYQQRGLAGLAAWWYSTLFDLVRTVIEQRRAKSMSKSGFMRSKRATAISLLLCLPIAFMLITAVYGPDSFNKQFTTNASEPTTLARIMMLGMLLGLPAAFLVNLFSMIRRATSEVTAPFRLTSAHIITGVFTLSFVLITLSVQVLHELRPFVAALGSAAALGQVLFFAGLLALPTALLFNRLPRFARGGSGGLVSFQPTSINLIVGAAVLLVILMMAGSFMLETIACASGVPNCD